MSFSTTRAQRKQLEHDNRQWPQQLKKVPDQVWPANLHLMSLPPFEVWRSRYFLAQLFAQGEGIVRISSGFADSDAVEVYPAQTDVVNVANMRHLFVLPYPLTFAWRKIS